jgi:hypothetical protein
VKVLAVYYSQTGRTQGALEAFLEPFRADPQVDLQVVRIEPKTPYAYPWSFRRSFSIFPEVVHEVPIPIEEPGFDADAAYDLIVLGGQVWFLSCSLPLSSFLQHPKAKVLAHTPVVPVVTFRRAWVKGLESIERRLGALGGQIVGRAVLRARDTIPYALFRGMRRRPPAGEKDWTFDREDLGRVRELASRILQRSKARAEEGAGTQPDGALDVLPPRATGRDEPFQERAISRLEAWQKERYLWWGSLIRWASKPDTRLRRFVALAAFPLYAPPIYLQVPLVLLRELMKRRGGTAGE